MMTDKKYISFSLWGNNPLYAIGAIRNAELVKEIYPDWQMIVYYDNEVTLETVRLLTKLGAEVVKIENHDIHPLFWRFYVLDREDCAYAIFRDADSRISTRESAAVQEWISENTALHVMRDHPYHEIPFGANKLGILGGMWGMRGGYLNLTDRVEQFVQVQESQQYGIDQAFLESIYEEFLNNRTVHDDFFEGKKFPVKRKGYRFIGERIDENEQPLGEDWKCIKRHEKNSQKGIKGLLKKIFK